MNAARLAKAAIKIPKRIERGSTDILKALASTVKYVPTEPDQVLQDDPYLLPSRNVERNMYGLSKYSGKSAAKFLLNKHPELFYRDDSEPKVRDYYPPEEFTADMDFTVNDLQWCIDNKDPINGVVAYKRLSESGVKIGDETLLQFFELLCYTNEDKFMDMLELHKSYFLRESERDLVNTTWNNSGLVMKIFNQIKTELDPPRVYSSMIAGLSKFNEHQTAAQLFKDFNDNHPEHGLYAEAYDGLLNSVPNLHSSVETAHEAVQTIVKHMEIHLVMPDLRVFNSILDVYKRFNVDESTVQRAICIVNDMQALNIKPSFFTYASLITIIVKHRRGQTYESTLSALLDIIYNNEDILGSPRDDRDVLALGSVMRTITTQMNNLPLANKLHKIYMKQPCLFSNFGYKNNYLDNYFRLLVTTERLEAIWQFYTTNVPLNFRPSPDSYDALAEALDLYQADEAMVTRVGFDIIKFRLGDKVKNDAIFRRSPEYVEKLEESLNPRAPRGPRYNSDSQIAALIMVANYHHEEEDTQGIYKQCQLHVADHYV